MAITKPINVDDLIKETADVVGVGGNYFLNGAPAGFFTFRVLDSPRKKSFMRRLTASIARSLRALSTPVARTR